MAMVDKRLIFGGIAALVVALTLFLVLKKPTPTPSAGGGLASSSEAASAGMPSTPVRQLTNKQAMYGTQLRQCEYPTCGANGNVSNCPKYAHPTIVGEDTAIYAIYNGTIHDPRLKSRMCYYYPPILCHGDDGDPKTYPAGVAEAGTGTGLQVAYGYNMRKSLIEGGAPATF